MAFPSNNAMTQNTFLSHMQSATTTSTFPFLKAGTYFPVLNVPAVVDVTGMEFSLSVVAEAATTVAQDIAGGAASTVFNVRFFDMGSTATGGTTNQLVDGEAFCATVAGGYTVHEAKSDTGTSTTDLDASDWVTLGVIANTADNTGVGSAQTQVSFIYGKPSTIN